MGEEGWWVTGHGKNQVDLMSVKILDEEQDYGKGLRFLKGITQTRGFKRGDWFCQCSAHVYAGRPECGRCFLHAPSENAISDMYRSMFNEHNLKIWDVHNGFVEVWETFGSHLAGPFRSCSTTGRFRDVCLQLLVRLFSRMHGCRCRGRQIPIACNRQRVWRCRLRHSSSP